MSASRRDPRSRFQPCNAAMYACTGASPSAFAICGLPPDRSFILAGLASVALGMAFTPDFAGRLAFVPAFSVFVALYAVLRAPLARDARLAFECAMLSVIIRPFLLDVSQVALGVYPR